MNHWLHMWTTDTTCETFNLLCEILTIWEPLTLLVKHSSYLWTTDTTCETFILIVNHWHYLWNIYLWLTGQLVKHLSYLWITDTTCETFILLVNHWHYLWNIYPTCESLTLLVKHLSYLWITDITCETFTCDSLGNLCNTLLCKTTVQHWHLGESLILLAEHSIRTDYLVNHTHSHLHTHTHTMPRHRTGKAAYLTTILNTQQRTSLQYSTPNRWFPLVSSQTKSVASVFCNQIFHKRPNLWGFPQCRNKE